MANELLFEMPLTEQFFVCDEAFMEKLQTFGEKNGIPDGVRVNMDVTHHRWKVTVKLTWEEADKCR